MVAGKAEAGSDDWFGVAWDDEDSKASITQQPRVIDSKMFMATSFCMRTVANRGCQAKPARMFHVFGMNGLKRQLNGMCWQIDGGVCCQFLRWEKSVTVRLRRGWAEYLVLIYFSPLFITRSIVAAFAAWVARCAAVLIVR